MKTKAIILKASILALFLLVSNLSWAVTRYVCIGTPLTLTAGLPSGTTPLWDVKKDGATTSYADFPKATPPTSFADAGSYEIILISRTDAASGLCSSDPLSSTIIVLPALAINLGTPTNPVYCSANNAINSSLISQATTGFPTAYTADVEAEYSYTVSKDGGAAVNGTTVGTIDPVTHAFTLTTTAAGSYEITGTVKYKQVTGSANTLLGNGCEVSSTTTKRTVVVTEAPAAPTITIAAG